MQKRGRQNKYYLPKQTIKSPQNSLKLCVCVCVCVWFLFKSVELALPFMFLSSLNNKSVNTFPHTESFNFKLLLHLTFHKVKQSNLLFRC